MLDIKGLINSNNFLELMFKNTFNSKNCKKLNLPFKDESFYLVIFDPPHIIIFSKNKK